MPVSVRIPTPLRKFTQGKDELHLDGGNVRDVMEKLDKEYPGLRDNLVDESGRFRRFVNVYRNGDDIRFLEHEQTPLKDGDELAIVPAIAGGR